MTAGVLTVDVLPVGVGGGAGVGGSGAGVGGSGAGVGGSGAGVGGSVMTVSSHLP